MSIEKDLGVTVYDILSPEKHINRIVGESYNLLRNIKVAFHYSDEDMMRKLIVTMICPKLEYAAIVWSPSTKMNLKERLRNLNLQTLEQ